MARGDFKAGTGVRGGKVIPQRVPVHFNVPVAATSANWQGSGVIVDAGYKVVAVSERHEAAGTDGGAVTVMVKKVPSGTAKGSGANVLSAGIDLKAAADTRQAGSLTATEADRTLAAGDCLALVPTGTLTALAGVSLTVWLERV